MQIRWVSRLGCEGGGGSAGWGVREEEDQQVMEGVGHQVMEEVGQR